MATLLEYANKVAEHIEGAEVKEVTKTNGVKKVGILIHQGKVCPTIYVEDMYDKGYSVEEAVEMVNKVAEENHVDDLSCIDKLMDYEGYVKTNLRVRLLNKKNDAEVKRSAAFMGFKELILVPYIDVKVNDGPGAVKVTNKILEKWDMSEADVIDQAIENTKEDVSIENLLETVAKMQGMSEDEVAMMTVGQPQMYIVSNKAKCYGAAAILGTLDQFKDKYDNGFYVVPSSVHEVIVVPDDGNMTQSVLNGMVRSVNDEVVYPEDYLADEAFYFC